MNNEKPVKSLALKMMTNKYTLLFSNSKTRLDMRFKINRQIAAYIKNNPLSVVEKSVIMAKQKERARNKTYEYKNVLQNPLLLDFRRNGGNVYCDKLNVYGRNHWAKKPIDFKVLEILMKNQHNKRLLKAS